MPIPVEAPAPGRRLLRDDVLHRLRDAIVDGTLEPGEQLRDGELAAWLGVSRTPVREALLRLAESGLVVAQPGRSTVVTPLDRRALREACDVVAAMHHLAVIEALPNLTADDLDAMRAANERFATAIDLGDVDAALVADDELHGVLVAVAANRAVAAVLAQFTPVLRRAERLRFSSADGMASVQRHADLIRCCADGDAAAAAAMAFDTFAGLAADPGGTAGPDPR